MKNIKKIFKKRKKLTFRIVFCFISIKKYPSEGKHIFIKWKRGKKWKSETPKYLVEDGMVFFNQAVPYSIKSTMFFHNNENTFKEKVMKFSIYEEQEGNTKKVGKKKIDLSEVCSTNLEERKDKTTTYKLPYMRGGKKIEVTMRFKSESENIEEKDYLDIADDIADDLSDFSFLGKNTQNSEITEDTLTDTVESESEKTEEIEDEDDDVSILLQKRIELAQNRLKKKTKTKEELERIRKRSGRNRRKESKSLGDFDRSLLTDSFETSSLDTKKTPKSKLIEENVKSESTGSLGRVLRGNESIDREKSLVVKKNLSRKFDEVDNKRSSVELTRIDNDDDEEQTKSQTSENYFERQSFQFLLIVEEIIENIVEPKYKHNTPFTSPILFKCLLHYKSFNPYKESPGEKFSKIVMKKIKNEIIKAQGNKNLLCYWLNTLSSLLNIINKFFQLIEDDEDDEDDENNDDQENLQKTIKVISDKNDGIYVEKEFLSYKEKINLVKKIRKRKRKRRNQFVNPIIKFKQKIKNLAFISFVYLLLPINEYLTRTRIVSSLTGCKFKRNLIPMSEILKQLRKMLVIFDSNFTFRELQIQFFSQIFYKINCILFNCFFDTQISFLKDVNDAIQLKMNLSQLEKLLQKQFKINERERILANLNPIKDICNLLMMNDKTPTIKQILKTKKSVFSLKINQVIMIFDIFNRNLKNNGDNNSGEQLIDSKLLKKMEKLLDDESELEMEHVLLNETFIQDLDFSKFENQYKTEDFDEWERVCSKKLSKMEQFSFLTKTE